MTNPEILDVRSQRALGKYFNVSRKAPLTRDEAADLFMRGIDYNLLLRIPGVGRGTAESLDAYAKDNGFRRLSSWPEWLVRP